MKIATESLPRLSTPRSAELLAAALQTKSTPFVQPPVQRETKGLKGQRLTSPYRTAALGILLAALAVGCGKDEEEPVQEEATPEPPTPILPPAPLYCEPEITCAGPPISHEAGFSQIEVGVRLGNEGCFDPVAAKNLWLGAAPANRRVVTEGGEDVQPNFPDDLLDQDTATVMPVTPTQAENRERIRRVLTVPQGDGNSFLVALQSNDILVDAAGRNHAARVAAGEVSAHPAINLNACFKCLTEDMNVCGEMQPWERDYCTWRYHPSIENVVGQVSRPTAPSTDVPPCEPEPQEPQAAVQKMIRHILAARTAREESQRAFRSFVEGRAA